MLWGLTTDQILKICQFAIFPACWWMIKWATRKIIREINDAVDARADTIAKKRAVEVTEQLTEMKRVIEASFKAHEAMDVQRFNDMTELINAIKI